MITAFQPNAFQHDAFQIFSVQSAQGGGAISYWEKKHLKKLIKSYEKIVEELPEDPSLISAIDPYTVAVSKEEQARRRKALYAMTKLPKPQRIDWFALLRHKLALEKYLNVIAQLQIKIGKIRQRREEEELIVMMIAEAI